MTLTLGVFLLNNSGGVKLSKEEVAGWLEQKIQFFLPFNALLSVRLILGRHGMTEHTCLVCWKDVLGMRPWALFHLMIQFPVQPAYSSSSVLVLLREFQSMWANHASFREWLRLQDGFLWVMTADPHNDVLLRRCSLLMLLPVMFFWLWTLK